MNEFLYRALNKEEIELNALKPKALGEFLLPPTPPLPVPFPLGETEVMAAFNHQYGEYYSTSGISTTFNKAIAEKYGKRHKVIVKLCRKKIKNLGIRELVLADLDNNLIRYPEDEEVILIFPKNYDFSQNIFIEKICID